MAAIVKVSYSSGGRAAGKSAGNSLRYFSQRPDYEGKTADREIVTKDGVYQYSRHSEHLQEKVEQQNPNYLYRIVMSSGDENMTQRQTEQWAQKSLESQGIHNYMLVAHAGEQGHTKHPHAHILVPTNELLNRQALAELREAADQQFKVHQTKEIERLKLTSIPDEASQEMKRSSGGKEVEIESGKSGSRRDNDYQLGR